MPLSGAACWAAFLHPEKPPAELLNATTEKALTFHDACIAAYPADDEFGTIYDALVHGECGQGEQNTAGRREEPGKAGRAKGRPRP